MSEHAPPLQLDDDADVESETPGVDRQITADDEDDVVGHSEPVRDFNH